MTKKEKKMPRLNRNWIHAYKSSTWHNQSKWNCVRKGYCNTKKVFSEATMTDIMPRYLISIYSFTNIIFIKNWIGKSQFSKIPRYLFCDKCIHIRLHKNFLILFHCGLSRRNHEKSVTLFSTFLILNWFSFGLVWIDFT